MSMRTLMLLCLTLLALSHAADGQIQLDWNDNTEADLARYHVYRASGSNPGFGSASRVATVTASAYRDTGLTRGTTYTYWVTAEDEAGNESPPSTRASATPPLPPPPPSDGRDPDNPPGTVPGLDYAYYHGEWSKLPTFAQLNPVDQGSIARFDISPRSRDNNFGFAFTGFIDIPQDGDFTFFTRSDDGSKLWIGNEEVVDNDGLHSSRERSGSIALKAGKHAIRVEFFEKGGNQILEARWSGPGISKALIPASVLYRLGDAPPPAFALGEAGLLNQDHNWTSTNFSRSYTTPIVVMGPPSYNGADASTMRVRNVNGNGFQSALEEYDVHDGPHTTEEIGWLVVEAGDHELEDGTHLQAGSRSVSGSETTITFPTGFSATPVVLAQVVSTNDARPVVTRIRSISTTSFRIRLQSEEGHGKGHNAETVHWIAIDTGNGRSGDRRFSATRTADHHTHAWRGLSFGGLDARPALLAQMNTLDGGDTAGMRFRNLSQTGAEVFVEEETSRDSEVSHTTERVGYLAITPGQLDVPPVPGGGA